jgi:hypothetical protein
MIGQATDRQREEVQHMEASREGRFAGDLTVLFAVGLDKEGWPRLFVPPTAERRARRGI